MIHHLLERHIGGRARDQIRKVRQRDRVPGAVQERQIRLLAETQLPGRLVIFCHESPHFQFDWGIAKVAYEPELFGVAVVASTDEDGTSCSKGTLKLAT